MQSVSFSPAPLAILAQQQPCQPKTQQSALTPEIQAALSFLMLAVAQQLAGRLKQSSQAQQQPQGGNPLAFAPLLAPLLLAGAANAHSSSGQTGPGSNVGCEGPTQSKVQTSNGESSASGPPAGSPSGVPGAPDKVPQRNDKPAGNHSVDDYLNANNGLLRNLGNQEGVKDKLKERYGNWEDPNRSEAERKQSAYNASRHVGTIKHKQAWDGTDRGDVTTNGKMEGATKDREIRAGTEMAALKDSLKGTGAEQDKNTNDILGNPNLAKTKDKHVRKNGTNRDNAEVIARDIGQGFLKGLSVVFGGVASLVSKTLGRIPGLGKLLAAPTDALFGTLSNYTKAGSEIVGKDLTGQEKQDVLDTAGRKSAGNAAGAFVKIVDPTGALAGVVDNAVQHAIDPEKVALDPGKGALDGLDRTGRLV
ncbi:hypothetical protein [Caldimonas brevitalea]|nr:hypothetical protein [Caldimonas brevitalea]